MVPSHFGWAVSLQSSLNLGRAVSVSVDHLIAQHSRDKVKIYSVISTFYRRAGHRLIC